MRTQGSLRYLKCLFLCVFCVFFFIFILSTQYTEAASIKQYSDRLSSSAPGESANHTINFKTTYEIPAGGSLTYTPEAGEFTIPVVNFDIDNIALYVATSSGYYLRSATTSPSATDDGIVITTGTSGKIEILLNSTDGIPVYADVRILIGSHTPNATTSDSGIMNPTDTGGYYYFITTYDGIDSRQNRGNYAILDQVTIPNIDTREFVPPIRFNGAPSGTISGTTLIVQISFETNEFARCRYSTASDTPYYSMGNEFMTAYATIHSKNIPVATSTSYTFFVRCTDDEGNINTDDYIISFTVPEYPDGVPGAGGDDEGEGEGTGEGTGESDPGDGDPSGGDDSSGGSSGGGGGGGGGGGSGTSSGGDDGGGGFEGSDKPYQSGDGRVTITGYAFPRSTLIILVDGQQAEEVTSHSDGSFSATIDEIARGAYTFGVYGIDRNGTRSTTFSTTFTITGSRGSTLSNINVMPSIKITPDPVEPGSVVKISGYTIPNATVTVENQNDKSSASLKTYTANSDSDGYWSVDASTDGFSKGTYKARAKAKQEEGISTNFSGYTFYGVGEAAKIARTSDLNRDGRVNLTDFSILLFWWNSTGGNSNPPADINADGRVSLTDFSIMIFNWTG